MTGGVSGHESQHMRSEDWITPEWILAPLGGFDLDPCACASQPWPTADVMLAPPIDGLLRKWYGRVWLNPPYNRKAEAWLRRMAEHGRGIALVYLRADTRAFQRWVWPSIHGCLMLAGRVRFCRPDGTPAGPGGGPSVLLAYSDADWRSLVDSKLPGVLLRPLHGGEKEKP